MSAALLEYELRNASRELSLALQDAKIYGDPAIIGRVRGALSETTAALRALRRSERGRD